VLVLLTSDVQKDESLQIWVPFIDGDLVLGQTFEFLEVFVTRGDEYQTAFGGEGPVPLEMKHDPLSVLC
jgi:hypothetical protein